MRNIGNKIFSEFVQSSLFRDIPQHGHHPAHLVPGVGVKRGHDHHPRPSTGRDIPGILFMVVGHLPEKILQRFGQGIFGGVIFPLREKTVGNGVGQNDFSIFADGQNAIRHTF